MKKVRSDCDACEMGRIATDIASYKCSACRSDETGSKQQTWPRTKAEMADEDIHKAASLPDSNPKTRIGMTKPSLRAIPPAAILHLGGAMADGEEKYGLFNWREHSVAASVYEDAIWRHLLAWRDGEDAATDSGKHHLAHVMACCAILLDAQETGNLIDDRGPAGAAAALIEGWTRKPID
ncbi:hypothetical protein PhaeoP66_03251 [Phaeobacter inhibens]|uniref:dATP/dGTP diphosphohydrolase N-terminal domain-containing protein n=1 Tax=Phaeobacter inhibens TaxID=221822 RepID=A0ABN5GR58_9RHOB|nr:dATP/dGTP diphosphohydrolase domain-containing protein [Phaeobacter inhibens]AUQ95993.1 hypothetical protein PhaeoP66_03251 [Phaeobacter inhibens]